MDAIVEGIAPIICQDNPTEECPAAVDVIIRQGLPALVAAGSDGDFGQVLLLTIDDVSMRPDSGWKMAVGRLVLDWINFSKAKETNGFPAFAPFPLNLLSRLATVLWKEPAPQGN